MKRLKNLLWIQERTREKKILQERTKEEEILKDLWNFDNGRRPNTIWWFCRKWKIENKEKYIWYQLRVMKRKLNIAYKMEEEERITKYNDVLKEYMEKIKKQLPSQ